jgi:hypothetical protein
VLIEGWRWDAWCGVELGLEFDDSLLGERDPRRSITWISQINVNVDVPRKT